MLVRGCLLLLVVLGACAADAPTDTTSTGADMGSNVVRQIEAGEGEVRVDVCALAAALPADDICHDVCDPDTLAARLAADGNEGGACYQIYCSLSETEHVLAGVCLP